VGDASRLEEPPRLNLQAGGKGLDLVVQNVADTAFDLSILYTLCSRFTVITDDSTVINVGEANHLIGKSMSSNLYPYLHFVTRLFLEPSIVSR